MIYATAPDGSRITATPGADATCPTCLAPTVAKCGRIVVHHWAHEARADCDSWAEPVGEWHLGWQEWAPTSCREITLGSHRADLRSPCGHVVELQHSPIPVDHIEARETFYGPRMLWIFDARAPYEQDRLDIRTKPGRDIVTFRWKQPRKSVAECRRRVLLDLGDGRLLDVKRMHPEAPCGGWGRIVPAQTVREWFGSWRRMEAAS